MSLTHKEIQLHYDGFLNTPFLWDKNTVAGLHQFEIVSKTSNIDLALDAKLRLGKYIERFVSYQLKQEQNIQILTENIQIQQNKKTLGELDCILRMNNEPIHLEIIYKFYLYDASVGSSEIDHFIGPNRKDSLQEKVNKLKNKQLPLLYSDECFNYLKTVNLAPKKIKQQVYFKGQLFVPYSNQQIKLQQLNEACIVGFYIYFKDLEFFKDSKFYVPNKKNWLINPHARVAWLSFDYFLLKATFFNQQKYSPLIWIKESNGIIRKAFLVWW